MIANLLKCAVSYHHLILGYTLVLLFHFAIKVTETLVLGKKHCSHGSDGAQGP